MQDFPEILVILVVYRKKVSETPAWNSLERELKNLNATTALLIYDNSPLSQVTPNSPFINVHYFHDASNGGVSAGYNFGNALALRLHKDWMLLLDQDSELAPGSLLEYSVSMRNNLQVQIFTPLVRDKKGILSPFLFKWGGGSRVNNTPPDIYSLKKYTAINSGMMINTRAFQDAGGYESSFPLDFSDIVFLKKFILIYENAGLVKAELHHELSDSVQNSKEAVNRFKLYCASARLFGKTFNTKTLMGLRAFLRAGRLALRYSSFQFVRIFFESPYK